MIDYAHPFLFIQPTLLREIDKKLTYAWLYGGYKLIQERVDEEGSGSFFGALHEWGYNYTIRVQDEVQVISDHKVRA